MTSRTARDLIFYRLEANSELPEKLRANMPAIIWIAPGTITTHPSDTSTTVLRGFPVAPSNSQNKIFVSLDNDGKPHAHFDIAGSIEDILLERYHEGLQPTIEMRLPFNYSRIPPWIKGFARRFRMGSMTHDPEVDFPSKDHPFVVDWLRDLAAWVRMPLSYRSRSFTWPNSCKAALTITHDVDTDWIFKNIRWLDQICDLEEQFGLYGAWYCVPMYSQSLAAVTGIKRLISRGCEIGCHGYNHDAKWPLLSGRNFEKRLNAVREFRDRWNVHGFRSEWLWRTPSFLTAIADVFDYDSSVPLVSPCFTCQSQNGCGTCFPYLTHNDMIELPLTLPMDDDVHISGLGLEAFWRLQVNRARHIIDRGGLVVLSLHTQPHQAANKATLRAVKTAIQELVAIPGLWIARPDQIAEWSRNNLSIHPNNTTYESH